MSEQERWQLGGNSPEVYERYLVPGIFLPWASLLIEQASLVPGQHVIDVACGTGVVARLAAPHVGVTGKVSGVDINPGMLAVARSLPPPQGAPVEWWEGDAGALPFAAALLTSLSVSWAFSTFPTGVKPPARFLGAQVQCAFCCIGLARGGP